jgi:hypothetical protein
MGLGLRHAVEIEPRLDAPGAAAQALGAATVEARRGGGCELAESGGADRFFRARPCFFGNRENGRQRPRARAPRG